MTMINKTPQVVSVWTFYGSVPFLRKHWSSTEELHFYGTATAYTTEELDFYGTSSRLFPQNSYFSEERSQIYKERLQNSKERCSILKITVVFLQNDTTFSSRSVVPCGPPYQRPTQTFVSRHHIPRPGQQTATRVTVLPEWLIHRKDMKTHQKYLALGWNGDG